MDGKADGRLDDELVTVPVPAFNAEATLSETLDSIRGQTHSKLEIVVVVDGAEDDTEAVARRHAAADARVSVTRVPNGGVARARNLGASLGRGAFIAPCDADDLWHPDKVRRQLAVFARDPELGFVYSRYRSVDREGLVLSSSSALLEGEVFQRLLMVNVVGNGSSIMLPREVFEAVGGYDPSLRDEGLQGAEDVMLQLQVARRRRVGVEPGHLVGYRRHHAAMSAQVVRMAQSQLHVVERVARLDPETPAAAFRRARAVALTRLAMALFRRGRRAEGAAALVRAATQNVRVAAALCAAKLAQDAPSRSSAAEPRRHFLLCDPDAPSDVAARHPLERVLRRSEALERRIRG